MTVFSRSRPDSQQTMTGLDDEEYAQKGLVEPRYMGTLADRRDMNALGRVQVLRVSCSALVMAVVAVLLTLGRETFGLSLLLDLDAL
ncbi:MAG: hypothetical protein LBE67_17130 [Kocuria palustris]|jgi:hypothetical protein|nr:hypothetical protein [Kocuria palustris]